MIIGFVGRPNVRVASRATDVARPWRRGHCTPGKSALEAGRDRPSCRHTTSGRCAPQREIPVVRQIVPRMVSRLDGSMRSPMAAGDRAQLYARASSPGRPGTGADRRHRRRLHGQGGERGQGVPIAVQLRRGRQAWGPTVRGVKSGTTARSPAPSPRRSTTFSSTGTSFCESTTCGVTWNRRSPGSSG